MSLSNLSMPELVERFNSAAKKVGVKPVKRFADRKTALRRLAALTGKVNKTSKIISNSNKYFLGMRQNLAPSDKQLPLKQKDSIRAKALPKLLNGMTMNQLEHLFTDADKERGRKNPGHKWDSRAYEMMRIFCYHYGYGTKIEGDKIFLVTKKG